MNDKGILKSSISLMTATCFMFFLYAPLELYFTNKNEVWYDIWVLLPMMVGVFFVFMAVCILAVLILYKYEFYKTVIVFMFIAFLCSYIQGNYMIGYLPVMDGKAIDWNLYAKEGRIQSIVLWVVVTIVVVSLSHVLSTKRLYTLICGTNICIILLFCVTLITLCISYNGLENKKNVCVTTDFEFTMSKNQNFIILLLDALDGGAFSEAVTGDYEREKIFEDFTYYDNTLCAYPSTAYNVPFILSGEWFENKTTSDEYFREVLTESRLFAELEERGYRINLYEPDIGIDLETKARFGNVDLFSKKVSSYFDFARWQIMLVGMKYAPFDLKRFSFVNPNAFERLRVVEGEGQIFHNDNMEFYQLVMNQEISYCSNNDFKFIHLWGAHPPYEYDKNMSYLQEGGTPMQGVESSITLTDAYLQKLKMSDMYDNSIIIILADHGNDEHYEEENYNQHPVLMIKGVHEKHTFRVDHRPISFADLQEAYIKLLDGESGQHVFNHLPQMRNRRFLWYDIKDDAHMVEYEQTGRAGDMETMVPTGQEFNAQE